MTPPALDRVVKKCLAKEPEKRWQAASDVCDELKWIAEGGSHVGLVPTVAMKGIRSLGRWALIVSLGTFLLGAVIASVATWNLKPLAFGAACLTFYYNAPARSVIGRFGEWPCCGPVSRWDASRVRRSPGRDPATLLARKKHSGVRLFEVKLNGSPTEIHLTVRDSGVGFDPELIKDRQGLGLIRMQERVRLVKGTISITSRPQSGTEINVRVPCRLGRKRTKLSWQEPNYRNGDDAIGRKGPERLVSDNLVPVSLTSFGWLKSTAVLVDCSQF